MSKLGFGLNNAKKPTLAKGPSTAKRKGTIFDESDSDGAAESLPSKQQAKPISTHDDLDTPSSTNTKAAINIPSASKPTPRTNAPLPFQPLKPPKIATDENLASKFSSTKHRKTAQELDPSIYDYDGVFDSLHAAPPASSKNRDEIDPATGERKPKYMTSLLAAAEVRKRDQLRAKEKMLAKEREAEGDEFADKEKFVTGAYKRQQAEMRLAEEAEREREREAEERRKREGGGMKELYKSILERDEQRHINVIKAVEENKGKEPVKSEEEPGTKGPIKTEAELAREKGALVNEDGEVVDKRQLLSAGLNAGAAPPKPRKKAAVPGSQTGMTARKNESARDRETRLFEAQLLGKRGASSDEDDDGDDPRERQRASKSQKLEDELLARLESP